MRVQQLSQFLLVGIELTLREEESRYPLRRIAKGCSNFLCTFLGVPIIRTIVYWGLYWGPLLKLMQMATPPKPTVSGLRLLRRGGYLSVDSDFSEGIVYLGSYNLVNLHRRGSNACQIKP